jgi:hypothetical protein
MKLAERKIETLVVERGRKDRLVFDDAQRGLAVRVTASGGRTYLCQYTLHGRKRRVPLGGVFSTFARERAGGRCGHHGRRCKGQKPRSRAEGSRGSRAG